MQSPVSAYRQAAHRTRGFELSSRSSIVDNIFVSITRLLLSSRNEHIAVSPNNTVFGFKLDERD